MRFHQVNNRVRSRRQTFGSGRMHIWPLILLLLAASPLFAQQLPEPERANESRYRIEVPLNDDSTAPASPVTAVTVFPGGADPDELQPEVIGPNGERHAAEVLWARKNEPIRVVFDTSQTFDGVPPSADHAIYLLSLIQNDRVEDRSSGTRQQGLTLETKNFGPSVASSYDHSRLKAFTELWNQSSEVDGRILVEKVQHGYPLQQPYGDTPRQYLPNMGAPLALHRYRGYFRVTPPDRSKISEFKTKAKTKYKKLQELRKKRKKLKKEVQEARKALQVAKQKRNNSDGTETKTLKNMVENRKTALEEWQFRLKKLNKKTLPEARNEYEHADAAISEIQNNTYTFLTGSDGASWVLVDGQEVAHWPADKQLPKKGDKYHGYNKGAINLKPGIHRVEYLYASTGKDYLTFMLWRHPAEKKPQIMQPDLFGNVGEGTVISARTGDGARPPAWTLLKDSRISGVPDFVLVDFHVPGAGTPSEDGDDLTYRWTFGDGSTGEGAQVQHLYLESGEYEVKLKAFESPDDDEPQWTVKQPVRVHVPYELKEYIRTPKLNDLLLEKDLSVYPVRHLLNALMAVEELDPNRLSHNEWRSRVLRELAKRPGDLATESVDWTLRAGNMSLVPTVALYDEAFQFFEAAAAAMDQGSPRWHRTKLREVRAHLLVRDAGTDALEMLKEVEPNQHKVRPEHLVAWWGLTPRSYEDARVPDLSGNGRDGTVVKEAKLVEEDTRSALRIDREAGSVRLPIRPDGIAHRSMTLSLRVKLRELPDGMETLVRDKMFTLRLEDGVPTIESRRDNAIVRAEQPLETDRWHHLLLERQSDKQMKLFLDGKEVLSTNIDNSKTFLSELHIGGGNLNFSLSDVRVYDRVLKARQRQDLTVDRDWYRARIEVLMSAGRGGEAEDLVERWARISDRIVPPDPVQQTATVQRIESLVERGTDQSLLAAREKIDKLLQNAPRRLLSGPFNITMLNLYLGRGANRVAANHAERLLSLQLASSHVEQIMALRVKALARLGDLEAARDALSELEEEYPYSDALRTARKALEQSS